MFTRKTRRSAAAVVRTEREREREEKIGQIVVKCGLWTADGGMLIHLCNCFYMGCVYRGEWNGGRWTGKRER
jgi:hypothetical protein